MVAAPGQFMGGTAGPNSDGTGGFNFNLAGVQTGLADFLRKGGTVDEYIVRAFPNTALKTKNLKNFAALPKSVLNNPAALRTGASRIAMMGSRGIPLLAGTAQALTGDPIGGIGTGIGGVAGGAIGGLLTGGNPLGIAAGSFIGSGLGQSGTRALAGIDMSDPYSGPNLSIPIPGGGIENDIPITPYAKRLKSQERARKQLRKDLENYMDAMKPYAEQDMARQMMAQSQIITGNLMQTGLANFGR